MKVHEITESNQQLNEVCGTGLCIGALVFLARLVLGQGAKQLAKKVGARVISQQVASRIGQKALVRFLAANILTLFRWAVYAFSVKDIYNVMQDDLGMVTEIDEDPIRWLAEFTDKLEKNDLSPDAKVRIAVDILGMIFAFNNIKMTEKVTSVLPKDMLIKATDGLIKKLLKKIKYYLGTKAGGKRTAAGVLSFVSFTGSSIAGETAGVDTWDKFFRDEGIDKDVNWDELLSDIKPEEEKPNLWSQGA